MPDTVTVDETGIRAASLEDNIANLRARFRAVFGADLSLAPQTPQSQMIGVMALALTEIGEGLVEIGTGTDIDRAPGARLDALTGQLGVDRRQATRSRVTATLTGVAGTGVPAGSRAKTDPGGAEFRTLAAVVLSPDGVSVEMEAVDAGAIEAPAGSLTDLVTLIAGWETVTNPSDASVGRGRESDAELRDSYRARTAATVEGPVEAIEGALAEALAGRVRVVENDGGGTSSVMQGYPVPLHGVLVVAETGSDADLRRAVSSHRSLGAPVGSAIRGGEPDETALGAVSAGSVRWGDSTYDPLDLSGAATPAARAAALSALLANAGVAVRHIDGRYTAVYSWRPGEQPSFGDGPVETAFGLDPDSAARLPEPFLRPRSRPLVVTADISRRAGFPADGLAQIRAALIARVRAYGVGEQLWANDLLSAAEAVGGTRVTALTARHSGADASGVAVPLDALWTLATDDLTLTVT